MRKFKVSPRAAGLAALLSAAMLAAWLACTFAGRKPKHEAVAPAPVLPARLETRRESLSASAKLLAGGSPGALQHLEWPSEEVVKAMGPNERDVLARGVARILDRCLSTNRCAAIEIEWGCKTLALLRVSDGGEAASVIRRVSQIPLQTIHSLEKLNQLETLLLAIYPELVSRGEAEPVNFSRSAFKKAIIRRQLYLLEQKAK